MQNKPLSRQQQHNYSIKDETAMMAFAAKIADSLAQSKIKGQIIFLEGNLGAGKTTFVRGFLRQLGYNGAVKSPTFTLVETYFVNNQGHNGSNVYHFDLYRLSDPEELDYVGLSDYLDPEAILLIEWPDKGKGFLPLADLIIDIAYLGKEREIILSSQTEKGKLLIASINVK